MKPRIDVLTLAVENVERSLAFYRRLGLESPGIVGTEFVGDATTPGGAVAMFELEGGLLLALYSRADLAKDAAIPLEPPSSGQFSIGQLVGSRERVDSVLAEAKSAGATLVADPHERPWGIYSGYFRDLDRYLWEIIWNPGPPRTDG
jgi:uncharacterized protein